MDKCSITYHGETVPLSMVLGSLTNGSYRSILHHAGPRVPEETGDTHEAGRIGTPTLSPADMAWLNAKAAFEYPSQKLLDGLIAAFVERFYPLYPVVHIDETIRQLRDRTLPWILVHAICFVSAGVCPDRVLHQAGYSRREIRQHFYTKTKALFDTNYEINQLVLLQTTTLMSFFMGRPYEYWNFWSWHASSVTMAESMGLHRSMSSNNLPARDKSLLRRIWWVIVIRDASTNSMVGRPFRVNSQQSDMEGLTMEDFEYEIQSEALKDHPLRDTFGLYQIHMGSLALILQHIILSLYSPARSQDSVPRLNGELAAWHENLPSELKGLEGTAGGILGRALSMVYQHHLILTNFRPCNATGFAVHATDKSEEVISNASKLLLMHACHVVRSSSTLFMPHECFAPLFVAQVVFLRRTRHHDKSAAEVANAALTTCQLLWHTISQTWESGPWVMDLFDKMEILVARLHCDDGNGRSETVANAIENNPMDLISVDPTFGSLSGYLDDTVENNIGLGFGDISAWNLPSGQNVWTNPPFDSFKNTSGD